MREIDVGNLAGIKLDDCIRIYGNELTVNRSKYNFKPYGGENLEMLKLRIEKFLNNVVYSGYGTIAAFCHGGVIAAVLDYIAGAEIRKYVFECSNCSINVFDYSNERWSVDLFNYTGPNI